jgi:hypothetical protein
MKRWEGPHEYPRPETSLDNRSEHFSALYAKLHALLSGPELGQGVSSFGKDADRFEWETDAVIENVLDAVDDMYGPKEPKGIALKTELLRVFADELKQLHGVHNENLRIPIVLGRVRAFLSQYMDLEYESDDSRYRKTSERAVSPEVKDIVFGLFEAVKRVPEGLRPDQRDVPSVLLETMLKEELENMYLRGHVSETAMKEALRLFLEYVSSLVRDGNTDPDGRWMAAFTVVENFCETHFPGMIVSQDDDEDDD